MTDASGITGDEIVEQYSTCMFVPETVTLLNKTEAGDMMWKLRWMI